MKNKYGYFISFVCDEGYGNCFINSNKKLNNEEEIKVTRKYIKEKNNLQWANIIFFKRIKRVK